MHCSTTIKKNIVNNQLSVSGPLFYHFNYKAVEMRTNKEAGTYCSEFIKLAEEFVEQLDQFLSSALRSQAGETHNVCKQDAVKGGRQKDLDLK